jgi:peptidoglycan/LPS O-acetylase OafA/YrhL
MTEGTQSGTHAAYRAVRVISGLDGLRGLSVLAVVWHHSADVPAATRYFPAARYGFLGVDLFFVISGFLIVTLVLRERAARGTISLRRFYARRTLRIFPLYYGLLAFFSVIFFWIRPNGSGAEAFRSELWVMLCYLSNWIPVSGMLAITWSLAAEEQFYLVWPPIEKWLARFVGGILVVLVVASQLVHFGWIDRLLETWFGWGPNEPGFLRQTTFTPILLGVALAHCLHDSARYTWFARALGSRFAAPLLLVSLVLLCNVLPEDIRGSGRLVTHVLMFFFLASVVVREDNGLRPLLSQRLLARIGALSYGIYLLHHIGLDAASRVLGMVGVSQPPVVHFLLGAVASIALAELSFRFYETPFLNLRNRFR